MQQRHEVNSVKCKQKETFSLIVLEAPSLLLLLLVSGERSSLHFTFSDDVCVNILLFICKERFVIKCTTNVFLVILVHY